MVGDDLLGDEELPAVVTTPCSTGILGADMAAKEESDCTRKDAAAASEVDEADTMLLDANAAADARTPMEDIFAARFAPLPLDREKSGLGSMTLLPEDEESSVW